MTDKLVEQRKRRFLANGGAHGVYLAALEDEKLKGRLNVSPSGSLRYQGQPMGPVGTASILVYLTGKYGLKPTEFELHCGLISAAEKGLSVTAAEDQGRVERELTVHRRLKAWLAENSERVAFSTEDVASEVLPTEYERSTRSTQMLVARLLHNLGYVKSRRILNGSRRLLWHWPIPAEEEEVENMMEQLPNPGQTLPDPEVGMAVVEDEPEDDVEMDPVEYFDEHQTPFDHHADDADLGDIDPEVI